MSLKKYLICPLIIGTVSITGCSHKTSVTKETTIEFVTDYQPETDMVEKLKLMKQSKQDGKPLYEVYKELPIVDVHNHDASSFPIEMWDQYGIDKVVLFGHISEPAAKNSDVATWHHYQEEPTRIYPSFAGFPIYEDESTSTVKDYLEKGYLNIGEVAAASTYSPVVSNLMWKSKHPYDGHLPEIYDLAAEYKVPILLHIDPPSGEPIEKLKLALQNHPNTIFIFGHANAYNSIDNIETLVKEYPNLYIDFFAGFTGYNPDSSYKIKDFIPLIEKYPDQFLFGTDSGYGISYEEAVLAIYETIDLLSPETAVKIAYQNYEKMIEQQPPTKTQLKKIKNLSKKLNEGQNYQLNKRMANELIFKLENKVKEQEKSK